MIRTLPRPRPPALTPLLLLATTLPLLFTDLRQGMLVILVLCAKRGLFGLIPEPGESPGEADD